MLSIQYLPIGMPRWAARQPENLAFRPFPCCPFHSPKLASGMI